MIDEKRTGRVSEARPRFKSGYTPPQMSDSVRSSQPVGQVLSQQIGRVIASLNGVSGWESRLLLRTSSKSKAPTRHDQNNLHVETPSPVWC